MMNVFQKYHIIQNFPEGYPLIKKIRDNLVFLVCSMIIHPRENLISPEDIREVTRKLRKGDVVLVGLLNTLFGNVMGDAVTHSLIYTGNKRFIHSQPAHGVEYISLHSVLTEYDTIAILRLPSNVKNRKKLIRNSIEYAKKQLHKPYNFDFKEGEKCLFCTQLVNDSYLHAGYKTGLASIKHQDSFKKKVEEAVSKAIDALRTEDMTGGNFEVVFLSHNLEIKNKKLF
ncbi:YiiX/YebB-like N1pC/P60 family cysteine hydrolase [Nanoarchaeota archaeon]